MKIKHVWSVLCKESVINQDDNNVSIFGVLEELSISLAPTNEKKKLPEKFGVPISYEIVSLWQKGKQVEAVNAEVEYILVDSGNKELLKITQKIEIPKTSRRFRSRMKIVGMPITKEGDYSFKTSIKEAGEKEFRLVSELPLEVKITSNKSPIPQAN